MDKQLLTYIEELEFQQNILKAELSLHEFIKQAWHVIEGDKEFIDGWHIQAICEHLEAVANRQIKNLIINIPPRSCKSSLVSIAFPAWVWLHNPNEQFLYASYALSLSLRDSVKCRRLISSPWYQERWGNKYQLLGDQNTKSRFDNTRNGYRIASSAGGSITGEGASMLFCDDPNNSLDGDSEVQRENKIDWWTQVWSTRLNDKKNDCRVVIQQRIHERDITGYILDHDDLNEWTKLILPMEFEEKRKSRTVVLPTTEGQIWEDPRVKEGQLLWPERINEDELKSLKQALGSSYAIRVSYNNVLPLKLVVLLKNHGLSGGKIPPLQIFNSYCNLGILLFQVVRNQLILRVQHGEYSMITIILRM